MGTDLEKRTISTQMLLDAAHLSPNEIEQRTGIPALEALQRLNDLLDSRDALSARRQERLLIIQMQDLVRDSKERLDNATNEEYAGIANVTIRAMKEIGIRFDQIRKNLDIDISEITHAQARTFGGAMDFAIEYLAERVIEAQEDGEVLARADILLFAREGLELAKKKLDESVGEE